MDASLTDPKLTDSSSANQANKILNTQLCDLLGSRYPIIQTAMGYVALATLVAATCNAGGFGFLAAVTIPIEEVEAAILKTASLTNQRFGVNFHMFTPGADKIADIILKHKDKVAAVSYGRGPNPEMIARFKQAGIALIPTVGKTQHAIKAVKIGADAIVVQGGEGGGHTGSAPTSIIVPQTVDAVDVPVIAAGGFKDGRGLVAALAYGAVGIAMGTRFLMTTDSPVAMAAKQRYVEVDDTDKILVTHALDGMPLRLIQNELLAKLEGQGRARALLFALINGWQCRKITGMSILDLLKSALVFRNDGLTATQTLMSANAPVLYSKTWVEGKPAEGALPGGQIAAAIDELESCEAVIQAIMQEAQQRLDALTN